MTLSDRRRSVKISRPRKTHSFTRLKLLQSKWRQRYTFICVSSPGFAIRSLNPFAMDTQIKPMLPELGITEEVETTQTLLLSRLLPAPLYTLFWHLDAWKTSTSDAIVLEVYPDGTTDKKTIEGYLTKLNQTKLDQCSVEQQYQFHPLSVVLRVTRASTFQSCCRLPRILTCSFLRSGQEGPSVGQIPSRITVGFLRFALIGGKRYSVRPLPKRPW
jgi:hypothetical protein